MSTTLLDNDVATQMTAPPSQSAPGKIDPGLLSLDERVAVLRATLGSRIPEADLQTAASALQEAEMSRWEQLPPGISPDMGFHFFSVCRETCWLGREILLFGTTFRIFRQRR
jgi:hypothetical protein